jgi:hypothetical protein
MGGKLAIILTSYQYYTLRLIFIVFFDYILPILTTAMETAIYAISVVYTPSSLSAPQHSWHRIGFITVRLVSNRSVHNLDTYMDQVVCIRDPSFGQYIQHDIIDLDSTRDPQGCKCRH